MKNDYKLICLDLDGTFLTSKHKLNQKTLSYVRKLIQNGINVSITTGRANFDARHHAVQMGESVYYASSNGASFGRTDQDHLIYEEGLSEIAIDKINATSKKLDMKPVFYTRDMILVNGLRSFMIHYMFYFFGERSLLKYLKFFKSNKKQTEYYRMNDYKVQKVLVFSRKTEELEAYKKELGDTDFDLAVTTGLCLEITPKGVNKAKGVKALARELNITKDEVIAFGDSENDIEMLKYVGCGVAMGNADQKVKEIADFVTDSNDDDGIYNKLHTIYGDL